MVWKFASIVALAVLAAVPVVAQAPIRSERLQFARGTSSSTVRGTLRGYETADYTLGAQTGQAMSVTLQTTNKLAYFNVLAPRSDTALFNGSIAGNRFETRLRTSGDYRIRVYLMRNAARRGERAAYGLTVAVSSRQSPGGGMPVPGGSGAPISASNMTAFCRGEASQQYGVRPKSITTGRVVADRGGSAIDGSADQGRNGVKRFRCRFDARNRFIDVMAVTHNGF